MDDKQIAEFAKSVGLVIVQIQSQLEAANQRLNALGEPTINVEAPSVSVGGAEVSVDVDAIVAAINAMSSEGLEAGLSEIAKAVAGQEFPAVDLTGVERAIREDKTAEAIGGLSERVEGVSDILSLIAEGQMALMEGFKDMSEAMKAVAQQQEKTGTATQMQFSTIAETMDRGYNQLARMMSAPKRIVEEDGKPVGVETVMN